MRVKREIGRESEAFLFTVEAEEGGPLPRYTSLTHVTFEWRTANCMPHDHKGLSKPHLPQPMRLPLFRKRESVTGTACRFLLKG